LLRNYKALYDGPNPTDRQIHELFGKAQIENSKMTKTRGSNFHVEP